MDKRSACRLKPGDIIYVYAPKRRRVNGMWKNIPPPSHRDMPVGMVERVTPNGAVLARCDYGLFDEWLRPSDIRAELYDVTGTWHPYHHVWHLRG